MDAIERLTRLAGRVSVTPTYPINVHIPPEQAAQAKTLEEFTQMVSVEALRLNVGPQLRFRYPDHLLPLLEEGHRQRPESRQRRSALTGAPLLGVGAVAIGTPGAVCAAQTRRGLLQKATTVGVAAATMLLFGAIRGPHALAAPQDVGQCEDCYAYCNTIDCKLGYAQYSPCYDYFLSEPANYCFAYCYTVCYCNQTCY